MLTCLAEQHYFILRVILLNQYRVFDRPEFALFVEVQYVAFHFCIPNWLLVYKLDDTSAAGILLLGVEISERAFFVA